MKFIYVLENEGRIQKDLFETLKSIDPKLSIRFFTSLAAFHDWLKVAVHEGPKALATGGEKFSEDTSPDLEPSTTHELRLVIAKDEFLGTQNMGLVKRARDFFIRKKMCSEAEPTALILTAFDSPDFDISLAEERIINNVIFKPFDKLILKQHLEYALTGHHPVKTGTVASFQMNSKIEMLKEIQLHSVTEVGFTTINNHEIKIGALTKYYGDLFITDAKKSMFAYCHSCKQLNEKEFLCEFLFFAAENSQISAIRRHILQNSAHETNELHNNRGVKTRVLVLNEDAYINSDLELFFKEKMHNADVYFYTHLSQLQADLADKDTVNRQTIPATFDFVIGNYSFFEVEKEKDWKNLCQLLEQRAKTYFKESDPLPNLYLISRKRMQVDEMKQLSTWAKDIFFTNLDKTYLFKKLLILQSSLNNKTATTVAHAKEDSSLKVANSVEISQISEAGVVLKYYRAISIGAFREFILWRPQELETPEIIGTVNYAEEDSSGEGYLNHFVFFGMTDHYLKHLRLWLLDNYIKSKDKS